MFTRPIAIRYLLILLLWPAWSVCQKTPAAPDPPAVLEFPVLLQDEVESGKTPVGTKVHAKLTFATLVNHEVIPKDAVFSGVVIESVAKTGKSPSRLAIRMDSVQWKG